MNETDAKKATKFFGLSRNVIAMGMVSFLNDISSDMIYPFIPIFLTSVLGATATFVGLVEGVADATASFLKIVSGRLSDRWRIRKPFVVFGYSLSAVAKPLLAVAAAPWHVLGVRFLDRVGKGVRDAPRDALISFSTEKKGLGRAFGFHRGADTLGAALGPLIAFAILPFINNDLRTLFLLSFFASFLAVLILQFSVREVKNHADGIERPKFEFTPSLKFRLPFSASQNFDKKSGSGDKFRDVSRIFTTALGWSKFSAGFKFLGAPFMIFLVAATIFSLGRASEAFLLLRAKGLGLTLVLLPIIYFVYSMTFALASTPAGMLSDKIGHRNTFMAGMLIFSGTYFLMAEATSLYAIWILFVVYGFYGALTDGVGRAIVADLVEERWRATAYGMYNAFTGFALLPASLVFGILWDRFGPVVSFRYGAVLGLIAFVVFLFFRVRDH